MMIVPEAADMPPTPWQTEILAPGIWAGAVPCIWRTLSGNVHAGMHVGEIAAIGVERQLEPGAVLRSPMKPLASSRGTKPSPLTQ